MNLLSFFKLKNSRKKIKGINNNIYIFCYASVEIEQIRSENITYKYNLSCYLSFGIPLPNNNPAHTYKYGNTGNEYRFIL